MNTKIPSEEELNYHQMHRDRISMSHGFEIQFALAAMKGSGILGASGVAALLAYVAADKALVASDLLEIRYAMITFGLSVVLSLMSMGCAYFSQANYTECLSQYQTIDYFPYFQSTTRSKKFLKRTFLYRKATVVMVLSSWSSLLVAVIFVSRMITLN